MFKIIRYGLIIILFILLGVRLCAAETNIDNVADFTSRFEFEANIPKKLGDLHPEIALRLPDALYFYWALEWNEKQYDQTPNVVNQVIRTSSTETNNFQNRLHWYVVDNVHNSRTTYSQIFKQREGYLPALIYNPFTRGYYGTEKQTRNRNRLEAKAFGSKIRRSAPDD